MTMPRTDLACEANEQYMKNHTSEGKIDGVYIEKRDKDGIITEKITIQNENGSKALNRPIGHYITIHAKDIRYDNAVFETTCEAIADELRALSNFSDTDRALVIGLGNREITPDALGHEAISKTLVTNHIKELKPELLDDNFRSVCALAPGVLGMTGIESADIIKAVVDKIKPDLVIVVDALAAADLSRICTTFQICDTGISPGSGVGNNRNEINEATLKTKVIAIGVPTVIDATSLCEGKNTQSMMVTPRDIDAVIKKAGLAIASGINLALHKNMSLSEICEYVG